MNKKTYQPLVVLLCLCISVKFFLLQNQSLKAVSTTGINSPQVVKSGSKKQKIIALTFDDGPHPTYTPQILDLLQENNAKATFFVLGMYAQKYPDIIKRQAKEGHEIGNHTFSHIDVNKVSKEKVVDEFLTTQEIITSLTGIKPKVFRPPYGLYNTKVMDIAIESKCSIILWSTFQDSKDWSNPGVDQIVNTTFSELENGDIILFHDYVYKEESHTVEALKTILPELKKKGYQFVTISELLELSEN